MRCRSLSARAGLVVLSTLLWAPGATSAQSPQSDAEQFIRWFADRCPDYLKEVSGEFERMLPESERRLYRSITVECIDDAGFGAGSLIDPAGRRRIKVTFGTLMALEPIATVGAAGSRHRRPLCAPGYIEHYGQAFRHNMRVLERGGKLRPVDSPYQFLLREDECPHLSEQQVRSDPELDDHRELMINAGLKFILAHEFAHHLLADAPRSDPAMERRCDEYAMSFLTRTGVGPFGAVLPLTLLAVFDDFSLRTEGGATHPAGGCRFLAMARAVKGLLDDDRDFRAYLDEQRPGMRGMFRQFIESMEQAAEEEGGC